ITAGAFGGPYTLEPIGDGLLLEPYEDYRGVRASVSTLEVYAGEPADMATRIHDGGIDVLTGRFDVGTLERLAGDDMLRMVRAESGRVRLLSFDLVSMPFGVRAEDADD